MKTSINTVDSKAEIFTLNKLVRQYGLDLLSNIEKDTLVSDIDETTNVFESLVLSFANKYAKIEIRNQEITNDYAKSIISLSANESELNVLTNHANLINIDQMLFDVLKQDSIRVLVAMEDNENYNIYFVDTFDILSDSDIKYINKLFNEIKKSSDETDSQKIQKLLDKQQECGIKYANKLNVLKQNQYIINKLAIFNKHFTDVVIAMYQLELILN